MKTQFALLISLISVISSVKAAIIVTFQPSFHPGTADITSQWVEKGLRFFTPNGITINDVSDPLFPFNGTPYAQLLSNQAPLSITSVNSSPFSVSAIDLAEYSTVFATPTTISFTGTLVGGGTVSTTFVTDGIIDGNGPLQDFQTFTFPASFSNLTQVTTNAAPFSFDNLQATIVPEPSTVGLFLLGTSVWIALKRFPRHSRSRFAVQQGKG